MLSTKTLCKALPQKSEGSANGAIYKSPGQARSASPWVTTSTRDQGLKGRNTQRITPFQGWNILIVYYQGRRAPLRFALAPGSHIPRRWRSVSTFEAKLRDVQFGVDS